MSANAVSPLQNQELRL